LSSDEDALENESGLIAQSIAILAVGSHDDQKLSNDDEVVVNELLSLVGRE